jgi:hypothetical protein
MTFVPDDFETGTLKGSDSSQMIDTRKLSYQEAITSTYRTCFRRLNSASVSR